MPKVSIIIPTLNRANVLKFALKSAVEQTYKDLEIIVCDDCSTDNTKEVVESFNNKSIIYVRPDKRLNMPDVFEFALTKSSGEYLTFLTDTLYLLPDSIDTIMKDLNKFDVKLALWRNSVYVDSDWFETYRRNTLYIPKVSYETYLLDSKIYLQKFYNNIRELRIPKSINSLCHRTIIENAIKAQGRFFLPPCPDHASAVGMLMNTPKFIFIDQPLFIAAITSANIGASQSFSLGKNAQKFLEGFNQKMEDLAFLGIYTTSSLVIKGLENVRKFYLDECPELNIKNGLIEIVRSLSKLETYKVEVNNYWRILDKYVSAQPMDVKFAVAKEKIISRVKWIIVKKIRSLHYLSYLEALRNFHIFRGEKYGFNNIEECAKILTPHHSKAKDLL